MNSFGSYTQYIDRIYPFPREGHRKLNVVYDVIGCNKVQLYSIDIKFVGHSNNIKNFEHHLCMLISYGGSRKLPWVDGWSRKLDPSLVDSWQQMALWHFWVLLCGETFDQWKWRDVIFIPVSLLGPLKW